MNYCPKPFVYMGPCSQGIMNFVMFCLWICVIYGKTHQFSKENPKWWLICYLYYYYFLNSLNKLGNLRSLITRVSIMCLVIHVLTWKLKLGRLIIEEEATSVIIVYGTYVNCFAFNQRSCVNWKGMKLHHFGQWCSYF